MSNDNSLVVFRDEDYNDENSKENTFHLYLILPNIKLLKFYNKKGELISKNDLDDDVVEHMNRYEIYNADNSQSWFKSTSNTLQYENFTNYAEHIFKNSIPSFFKFIIDEHSDPFYTVDKFNRSLELQKTIFKDVYISLNENSEAVRPVKYNLDNCSYEYIFFPPSDPNIKFFFNKSLQNRIKKYDATVNGNTLNLFLCTDIFTKSDSERFNINLKVIKILRELKYSNLWLSRNSMYNYNIIEFSFNSKKKLLSFDKFIEKEFNTYNLSKIYSEQLTNYYCSKVPSLSGTKQNTLRKELQNILHGNGFSFNGDWFCPAITITASHENNETSAVKLKKIDDYFVKIKEHYHNLTNDKLYVIFSSFLNTSNEDKNIIIHFDEPNNVEQYEKIISLINKGYIKCTSGHTFKSSKKFSKDKPSGIGQNKFEVTNKKFFSRLKIDSAVLSSILQITINTDNIDEIYDFLFDTIE